jgi:hypothetical protein
MQPRPLATRHSDVLIARLNVVLPGNRDAVPKPAYDVLFWEILYPICFTGCPEILVETRPSWRTNSLQKAQQAGSKIRGSCEVRENMFSISRGSLSELRENRLQHLVNWDESEGLSFMGFGLGGANGHHFRFPIDVSPAKRL